MFPLLTYSHLLNPHWSHTLQPASLRRGWPHSGHLLVDGLGGVESCPKASSMALAMASGHDCTSTSRSVLRAAIVDRHRIPLSCSTRTFGSTPDRRATETARHVASDWAGQPPAFPRFPKTSARPEPSLFTVMNRVPQPMRCLNVWPSVLRGRGRGEISDARERAAEVSTWSWRQPSRYTVMPLQPSS